MQEDDVPAVFDRYTNAFLKIYFEIPAGREDEYARKVLITHLREGNSYGIWLKLKHAKFPQPELGPWRDDSPTVGGELAAPGARGRGAAGGPLRGGVQRSTADAPSPPPGVHVGVPRQTWIRRSTASVISATASSTGTPFFCSPLR